MRSRRLFEIRREVLEALRRLAKEIDATIYLIGSYARGNHTLESDVDIIVVCEHFRGMKYPDRVEHVRTRLPGDIGFDVIALTPEELEDKMKHSFFRDVSKYWIKIKP